MKQLILITLLIASMFAMGCQKEVPNVDLTDSNALTGAAISVPMPEPENKIVSEEISCYGKEGFNPTEITTSKNTPIYFLNKNKIDMTITIQKASYKFITTKIIPPSGKYAVELDEEGEYTFWDTNYAPRGKITVK